MHADAVAIASSEKQLSEQERAHLRVPSDLHRASSIPLPTNDAELAGGVCWDRME